MVGFTKAVSGDVCLQRLTDIEQGLAQNKRIDTSLEQSNRNIIFDLWSKYIVRPLYSLIGWEYSATFRAKNVASSILNFCQANQEYLKDKPEITQKAVAIINTLDGKTKQKYHADLETSKTELAKLTTAVPAAPNKPEPQDPTAVDPNAKKDDPKDASNTAGSAAPKPNDPVTAPTGASASAPAQTSGDLAANATNKTPATPAKSGAKAPETPAKEASQAETPADKTATDVAADVNAAAGKVLPATPGPTKEQAAVAAKTPVAPQVNLEIELSDQDVAKIDERLQAATAQLGYNTMLQLINDGADSVCLSPVGLTEMMEVLARGMLKNQTREHNALRKKMHLDKVNDAGIAPRLADLRDMLKEQGIDILTAVLAKQKFGKKEDEEYVQKIKDFGVPVFEHIDASRKESAQTVRAQFAAYIRHALAHDAKMPDVMHNDWSKSKLAPKLGYNVSTVANVQPQVAIEPISVATDQVFTFSDGKKTTKVDLYTFENVKAIETAEFSMALVPYETADEQPTLSKLVFVPKNFEEFASTVTPGFVAKCLEELDGSEETIQLEMPKTNIQVRHRELLDLYTHKDSASDVKLPVKHLVGRDTTSLMQTVYFTESFYDVAEKAEEKKDEAATTEAAAAQAQAPKTMKVNQSYYYLVLSDNNVVLQGCVNSKEGLSFEYTAKDL